MSSQDTDSESNQLQFLISRYSQLNQQHTTNNQIIHTTFYLSVVFFGILLGGVSQLSDGIFKTALYLFAGFIFLAMLLWTRTYLNGRNVVTQQKETVLRELEAGQYSFKYADSVDQFFPDESRRDFWEKSGFKDRLLQAYYLVLAALSVAIPIMKIIS